MYQEQIKELLERYIKGECSDEESALLEKWYDRLTLEKDATRLLSEAEEQRLVQELWEKIALKENPELGREPENRLRSRRVLRYAAVWEGMIIVSGGIWMQWNRKGLLATAKRSIAHTTIREAFFEVRRDAAHPFVVLAGNTSTVVLGTSFNISAYPEAGELRISLKSGKVGIQVLGSGSGDTTKRMLSAGQIMIYDKTSGNGEVVQEAPGEMDVWTAGRMLFYKTPLKEALAQIEARYGVHIIYDHPITNRTITSRFENTALEKVLQSLSFGWDLHFTRTGDTLHVR